MSASKIIEVIRSQNKQPRGIELATVTFPPPSLKIRVDNMPFELEGSDLLVLDGLLEHEVEYSASPQISATTSIGGDPGHAHTVDSFTATKQKSTVHTKLKAGDRVAVIALPGEQQYLVLDKVVIVGG